MVKWSFEVRHGDLATLPSALASHAEEQRKLKVGCFLISERGYLLNEPEEQTAHAIRETATPAEIIGGFAKTLGWLFDCLEVELVHHFRYNYVKVSFVNLHPIRAKDVTDSGQMTTNFPELPETVETSPELQFRQIVKSLGVFFSHLRGAVEIADWRTETFSCDWVSLTFSKVS